ncbi:MAG: hypothetical protein HKO07_07710, partial [Pseudomonadales bacterium]|nr:hypothetical protein [Pseudomonadales bacterium]
MWQYRLLMDALLNGYYAAMAVYGWMIWQAQDSSETGKQRSRENDKPVAPQGVQTPAEHLL